MRPGPESNGSGISAGEDPGNKLRIKSSSAVGFSPHNEASFNPLILHGPSANRVEADVVDEFSLGHDLVVALVFDARGMGLGDLDFVHQAEFHFPSPLWSWRHSSTG